MQSYKEYPAFRFPYPMILPASLFSIENLLTKDLPPRLSFWRKNWDFFRKKRVENKPKPISDGHLS